MSKYGVDVYQNQVAVRYQLYNALFTTLPYEELKDWAPFIPAFAIEAKTRLELGESPVQIVESFLEKFPNDKHFRVLFHFLQQVERQITLFDAVEDAAISQTHDLRGPGTLDNLLDRVHETATQDQLISLLDRYRVRIVLTAHPTQFYPDSVLGILRDLGDALKKDDLNLIRLLLLQLARTQFRNRSKPTPLQEARSVLWYIENNFYPEMASIQRRVSKLLPYDQDILPPLLEIGFWPGGDRDGNPFVNSDVTIAVAKELRNSILNLYISDSRKALRRLTFPGVYEPFVALIQRLQSTLDEPLHQLAYINPKELIEDLKSILQVINTNHHGLFADLIEELIGKVHLFGFHFASIDLRQDSRIHEQALDDALASLVRKQKLEETWLQTYRQGNESTKIEFLCHLLSQAPCDDLLADDDIQGLSRETILSYQAVHLIQHENGQRALHRSIISNTQSSLDLIEVLTLVHLSGWNWKECQLDIVPLFETIEDLHNSQKIMDRLYQLPLWLEHLGRRKNEQNIMLGFSDGTKDGGYLGANWGIYEAKRNLTTISRNHGIHAVFFDGRGGPPGRGGGNSHRFYMSLGKDIEHDQIQLTIQGQTISSNYGTPEICRYNLEQLFTAGLESFLFHADESVLNSDENQFLDELAVLAKDKYLEFKNCDLFVPYLEEMTPLRYYDRLNVGSRPAKRSTDGKLRFEDLRAIPFVGSWSQIKQNIPGFYGLGTALAQIRNDPKRWNVACQLFRSSLFFSTLIDNAAMSLSKTYFPLTAYLKNDPRFGDFWRDIYTEAELSELMVNELSGDAILLEREASTRLSIELRNKIVLPLLVIQQYALDRVRTSENGKIELNDETVETLRKLVVKSLAANINASRNSA